MHRTKFNEFIHNSLSFCILNYKKSKKEITMSNRKLTERLNNELDSLGVPELVLQRVQACSRMFKLPKSKVEALLYGMNTFDLDALEKIAIELDVNKDWLLGYSNQKTKH